MARVMRALSCAAAVAVVDAAQWAVVIAGSNGYFNYRHQADACHAYQVLKAKGVHEDNIIHLAYDDIAHNIENPFPGKLYNKPDKTGPGKDVYAGCKIDYKGKEVTPANFIGVLLGNASGKVLKSTSEDDVFVYFTDHGAPGLIAFPSSELHKVQLQTALKLMHRKKMFKKLVFYLEACESGSMFQGMKTPGVYALSAANGKESSWGTYCGKESIVNGKSLETCLGDLFSVAWLEDSDVADVSKETLEQQFKKVKSRTNKSHVLQWGDTSFTSDVLSSYIGGSSALGDVDSSPDPSSAEELAKSAVSARHVDLHRLYEKYAAATTAQARTTASIELQRELAQQQAVEATYLRLVELAYPGDAEKQAAMRLAQESPDQPECELEAHAAIRTGCAQDFDANSGFALQFHQVVVNLCAAQARGELQLDVVHAARSACGAPSSGTELVV